MERNETRGIPRPYHREENDQGLSSLIIDKVKKLFHTTDIEHLASNCIGRIGNPVAYQVI